MKERVPWEKCPTEWRLVLLGAPLGNPADASARLRDDARRRRRGRRRGHPPAGPARPRPRRHRRAAGSSRTSRATRSGVPPNWSTRSPAARSSRWSPTAACPASPTPATGWSGPRSTPACRSPPRPGRARSPPRWRSPGCPATGSASRASCPASGGARRARLRALAAEERTLVFFEAPHRLAATLADLAAAFGADRPAALCRELTKTYEEVLRRPLGELAAVGRRRRAARRDHAGRGRRPGRRRRPVPTPSCAPRSPTGRPPVRPDATPSPPSRPSTACAAATSTTLVHQDRAGS